ncbi:MAG: hypothetical protein ACE5FJ_04440 [Gemmatimonadales bacterium]
MISNALDYTAIASWDHLGVAYLVQVASLLETPVSLVIEAETPDSGIQNAMIPTTEGWQEIIGFWNGTSDADRSDYVGRVLDLGSRT